MKKAALTAVVASGVGATLLGGRNAVLPESSATGTCITAGTITATCKLVSQGTFCLTSPASGQTTLHACNAGNLTLSGSIKGTPPGACHPTFDLCASSGTLNLTGLSAGAGTLTLTGCSITGTGGAVCHSSFNLCASSATLNLTGISSGVSLFSCSSSPPGVTLKAAGCINAATLIAHSLNSTGCVTVGNASAPGTLSVTGSILANGSLSGRVGSHTSNYKILPNDFAVLGDTTNGGFTFTLPLAGDSLGRIISIKKTDETSNTLKVKTTGTDTIDHKPAFKMSGACESLVVISGGNGNWFILSNATYS